MPSSTILSDNGVSSGTSGIKTSGGNDGLLLLQTTTAGGTATTAVTIGTDQSVTFAQGANLPNTFGFKNRIINGAMMIDQRNAGASVTVNSASNYTLDRYEGALEGGSSGRFTVQRSSTAPAGFVNSALLTVTTTATPSGTNYYLFQQKIEGFNMADLAWGTASASAVTVSFWIRGSVTGTYPFYLLNGSANLSYVGTFTINVANTWEYKTIAVPGPTSGTWATDNSVGIYAGFGLGSPAGRQATANTWTSGSGFYNGTSSTVNFISNSGATLYITGVQLEKGSTATSFDYRPYGTELALCQRYLPAFSGTGRICQGMGATTSAGIGFFQFPVITRVAPTGLTVNSAGYFYVSDAVSYDLQCNAVSFSDASNMMARIQFNTSSASQVANRPQSYWSNNSAAILYLTGCEL